MSLVPDRFIVTAIVRELDEDGNVVGEKQSEPVVFFTAAAVNEWTRDFPDNLARSQREAEAA